MQTVTFLGDTDRYPLEAAGWDDPRSDTGPWGWAHDAQALSYFKSLRCNVKNLKVRVYNKDLKTHASTQGGDR
jgi:hypothetical protein